MSAFFATLKQAAALLEPLSRNATILADDIVGLAKPAIAAADDIAALSKPALSKASAVVVDDTAVCSDQLSASAIAQDREYTVWGKIVGSSLANKVVISGIIFAASAIAPIVPQIMLGLGGCYLAYEGAHKVHEYAHNALTRFRGTHHNPTEETTPQEKNESAPQTKKSKQSLLDRFLGQDPNERRLLTDLIILDAILSTEILLITNGLIAGKPALLQAATLGIVSTATTFGVYGAVLAVIRADNIAASLSNPKNKLYFPKAGKAIMRGLPHVLKAIGAIGTVAMLGVGGEVLGHLAPQALEGIGATTLGQTIHHGLSAFTQALSTIPVGTTIAAATIGLGSGLLLTTSASLATTTSSRLKMAFAEKKQMNRSAPIK